MLSRSLLSIPRAVPAFAPVATLPARAISGNVTEPRFKPHYDREVVRAHPRVLDAIEGRIAVKDLTYTERVAHNFALYKLGGNQGRNARRKDALDVFNARVSAYIANARAEEALARQERFNKHNVRRAKNVLKKTLKRGRATLDRSAIFAAAAVKPATEQS